MRKWVSTVVFVLKGADGSWGFQVAWQQKTDFGKRVPIFDCIIPSESLGTSENLPVHIPAF